MSDYHNATHRAVGPDLACKVCKLIDAIGLMPHAEQEAVLDRLLDAYDRPFIVVHAAPELRVADCRQPCCVARQR